MLTRISVGVVTIFVFITVMPSDKCNSIMTIATGLIASLFIIASSQDVPRGGFRGVSEVSGNHSGFSLDDGCGPFPLQRFTRHK